MAGALANILSAILAAGIPQTSVPDGVQTPPAPTVASQAFDAWEMRCETMPGMQPVTRCGVLSSITTKSSANDRTVVAVVMVRRVPGSERLQLSIDLPNVVWLPTGVALLDATSRERVRLPFVTCEHTICQAGTILSAAEVDELADAGEALTAVYDLKTRQQVKLRFSMRGFVQALSALKGLVTNRP